ncbi:MAG: thymidine phosphorylase [Mycoplasmataceae bacterium]|jgi:pyrimidine-nucleoside phosphorylase|nr:thymidine phosphorylase [Mycoplasmataceae bacterium]
MDILSIIEKKRTDQELTKNEIFYFIDQLVNKKTINDYQAAALIMAININGMNPTETFHLTDAMLKSGEIINLDKVSGVKIDKHSTGGVGDKVSLILSPICAALGIKVAKISGKGLGHTGGTIDKLESIGVDCNLNEKQYLKLLKDNGLFIMAQTDELTPADRTIYALRNATSTVQSIPLIASSIACKKLALKTDYIFLDVKVGDGGFCKTINDATKLSHALLAIFKECHRKAIIHITNMTQPLGRAIGNAIEIKASIDFLKGNPECDEVKSLIYDFVADIMLTVKKTKTRKQALMQIEQVIQTGKASKVFNQWVISQHANANLLNSGKYFNPRHIKIIKAPKSGYVDYRSTKTIGLISFKLGAGRLHKEDPIDFHAGIYLNKIRNEYVKANETLATFYSSKPINRLLEKEFLDNVLLTKQPHKKEPIIVKVMK